ncbi:MAG: hypothetical protein WDA75_16035 [Candidatus Latescibacterota bacterium]|jgi:hypothetical protein
MANGSTLFAQVVELARQLTPLEKVQLIEQVTPDLEDPLKAAPHGAPRLQSAYGLCARLGTAPSEADLDSLRQEVLQGFPRGDL